MRFAKLTQSAVTAKSNTTAMVTLNLDEIAAVAGGDAAYSAAYLGRANYAEGGSAYATDAFYGN